MTLQYTGTLDIGSKTWYDGVYDEDTAEIIIVASDTLRKYSLETGSQVGSDLSLGSTGRCVALVGASAIVGRSTSSSWSLVELESLYESNFSVSSAVYGDGQASRAYDRVNKVALFSSSSTNNLTIYDGNSFTVTNKSPDIASNTRVCAVAFKESGRFLLACNGGAVYEVNSNGDILKSVFYDRSPGYAAGGAASIQTMIPNLIDYYDGFVYVYQSIPEDYIVIDWTTGTVVHRANKIGTDVRTTTISASGIVLVGREDTQSVSSHSCVYEVNPYNYGWLSNRTDLNNDILYVSSPGGITAMGFDSASSIGWFLQETIDDLRTFTVSATSGLTETTHSSPNNEDFRLIIVDETNGQGSLEVVVDTYTTSPRTLHLPAGRDMIEIIKVGDGVNAQWDVSRYST